MSEAGEKMVQAFLLPVPGQGHINPIVQFGKRLAAKGIRVTLVTTIFRSKTMLADPIGPINIQAISDGFDDGYKIEGDKTGNYFETFKAVGPRTLFELIQKQSSPECPVTCLVYDSHLPWALGVARRCGLLAVAFFTQSLAVDLVYYNVHKGRLDAPPSVDTISLPGLPPLKHSDLPSFVLDPNEIMPGMLNFLNDQFSQARRQQRLRFELLEERGEGLQQLAGRQGGRLGGVHLLRQLSQAKRRADQGNSKGTVKESNCYFLGF